MVIVVAFTSAGRGEENAPLTFFAEELPPERAPDGVTFERSDTTISVEWEPISLFEARGFPIYTITLIPDSMTRKRQDGVITVTTNETSVVIDDLDPNVRYSLTVAVGTTGGQAFTMGSMF